MTNDRHDRAPAELAFSAAAAGVTLEAAAAGDEKKLRAFKMTAYTGGAMTLGYWPHPVVVELTGIKGTNKPRPILKDHDAAQVVGHTTEIKVAGGKLLVAGVVSGVGAAAAEVVGASDNGFPWQASIGASVTKVQFIDEGKTAEANGQTFKGPVYVVKAARLGEVSFVALGADDNTSATVAAGASAHHQDTVEVDNMEGTNIEGGAAAASPAPAPVVDIVAEMNAKASANAARIAAIEKVASGDILAKAIKENWTAEKAELETLRASRPVAPAIIAGQADLSADVLETAVLQAAGMEKGLDAQKLEAAHKRFRSRIGIQELIVEAARRNGWTGGSVRGDLRGVIQAAFSTRDIGGILSNVANKFLAQGFNGVEAGWQQIAAIRSANDFKTMTSYALTGSFGYEKVAPDGEIQHAAAAETSYTNKVDTYAKMFAVTRQDIINDDLGAITGVPAKLGRGGALKLNTVFWEEFADNSTFFTTARGNLDEGTDTALGISSLILAEALFGALTDPDGNPTGVIPSLLVVPRALGPTARQLVASQEVRQTTASQGQVGTANPFAGRYTVVESAYLANSNITGNSAIKWYLLANPMDLPVIEVAFLNGQQMPTIESADADFTTLGIQMRGYHDFGVSLQEYRGGVAMKGTT